MALLNWGNALSQAGKAMAAAGLEGVKSTLEQDKVRLASSLAAENEKASDVRRAESAASLATLQAGFASTAASKLADVNTETERLRVITNKNTALALEKATNQSPQALAALNSSNATKALADFTLTNEKAVKGLQERLAGLSDDDLTGKADLKQQITALGTTAATIAADKTGATALYTANAQELSRATPARYNAAAKLAADPTNADAISASKAAIETEQYARRTYRAALNYLQEKNPDFKIPEAVKPVVTGRPQDFYKN